jgi:hypothetical protein
MRKTRRIRSRRWPEALGQEVVRPDRTMHIRGMIFTVKHLVAVEEVK